MRFTSEPVPSNLDPVLAEYLDRQFNNVANSMDAVFVAPVLQALPRRDIPGGIVYIEDDGLYACVSTSSGQDAEWRKLTVS